eukprot:2210232-Rhodomonas_salina.2
MARTGVFRLPPPRCAAAFRCPKGVHQTERGVLDHIQGVPSRETERFPGQIAPGQALPHFRCGGSSSLPSLCVGCK